jgi:hypothetical protein
MTPASAAPATYDAAIPASPSRARIASVDVVRGAVMVLMALDHVRDYVTILRIQPEDLARGSAALFATRWVTHFCAPGFFLLAGIGIGIAANRGAKPRDSSRYLITRGLWYPRMTTGAAPGRSSSGVKSRPRNGVCPMTLKRFADVKGRRTAPASDCRR